MEKIARAATQAVAVARSAVVRAAVVARAAAATETAQLLFLLKIAQIFV